VTTEAPRRSRCALLEVEPELAGDLEGDRLAQAREACVASLVDVPSGPWRAEGDLIGYLVVSGVVAREIGMRDRRKLELLGPGDVIQPPGPDESRTVAGVSALTVVSNARLAVLDGPFLARASRWPSVPQALFGRLEAQRERLAVQGLTAHLPRADHRLLALLWHLADRWGRVGPDGVMLPLPLTHAALGLLTGSRRPTVSVAVGELEAQGLLHRRDDGCWVLAPSSASLVRRIAGPAVPAGRAGESLRLNRSSAALLDDSRALVAQARHLRRADWRGKPSSDGRGGRPQHR
jgi:CRP/FNR family cyclic AMP-dependent transcriptional regulator